LKGLYRKESSSSSKGNRKESSGEGGRNSPELDDFFDQTDDFND